MDHVFFDLSGTIINHETNKPIFFMPYLMKQMINRGWKVSIISRYSEHQCRSILKQAGIHLPDVKIYSSLGSSKGDVLYNIIKEDGRQKYVYIDDKPENLETVRRACGNEVRIIGFVGSRKYTPGLSKWCFDNEVELALSPVDLCEGLPISVDFKNALDNFKGRLSLEDIAGLISGLDHPLSSTAGETDYFEHRHIFNEIFDKYNPNDYESVWLNMGWISCNECIWKALVETVIRSLGFKATDVIGNVNSYCKHYEYTSAMKEFCENNTEKQKKLFYDEFHRALDTIKRGIKEIGSYAERCRIASKKIELNRIELIEQMVNEVFDRNE